MKIDKKISDILMLAAKYPTIKRVGIFGSYARNDTNKESDIDLIYDYDDSKEQSTDELLGYVEEIDGILKEYTSVPKIDYVWYKGVMESENKRLYQNILNDVIWIYDVTQK